MPIAHINGHRLFYVQGGSGEPVVLVHGGWSGQAVWQGVNTVLSESFEVLAYDRLGYNASDRPDVEYTRRRHEDDLIALIEYWDRGPVHLVGSSYGAAISLAVAGRRPDLVRGVVAHEPPLIGLAAPSPALDAVLASFHASVELIDAGDALAGTRLFFEEVALGPCGWYLLPESFQEMAVRNAPVFAAETKGEDWALDGGAVAACPGRVLLTQGDQSPEWFAEVTDATASVIPHAERITVEGAGHGPHSTHPVEYAELVGAYLKVLV